MDVDLVFLLVLELVQLLSSLVKISDVGCHIGVIARHMVHFADATLSEPSADVTEVVVSLLMILVSLDVQNCGGI
jgi:hypothetical protein